MSAHVIDLPRTRYTYQPVVLTPCAPSACPRCAALAPDRPSLLWQVLALAVAVAGLALAGLVSAVGLLTLAVALFWLALPTAVGGLGLTAGLFLTEVILCGAGC